jgi:predicted dehydrogenase
VAIRAVVDVNAEAARKLGQECGAEAFDSLDEALAASSGERALDGVVICTPPSARVEVAERALAAGLSVLLEKPLAHTLEDGRRLAELAEAHPGQAGVMGFCHRFTPAVDTMIDRVAAGLIGRVVRFENTFAANLPHLEHGWMSDPALSGGGSLMDTGMHSLDLFRYLFGPASVDGAVFRRGWAGRGESNATVLLSAPVDRRLGDGRLPVEDADQPVAGVINCGWAETSRFDIRLVGSEGVLFYDFDAATALLHTDADGRRHIIEVPTHEVRFTRQLEAFIGSLSEASSAPLCGVAEGLASLELVFEAAALDAERRRRQTERSLQPNIVQSQPAAQRQTV